MSIVSPVGNVLSMCKSARLSLCLRWWLYADVVSSYCLSVIGKVVMEGVGVAFMGVAVVMCVEVVFMSVEVVAVEVEVQVLSDIVVAGGNTEENS